MAEITLEEDDVVEILDRVENEAQKHEANYASGMREARRIVEEELKTREATSSEE